MMATVKAAGEAANRNTVVSEWTASIGASIPAAAMTMAASAASSRRRNRGGRHGHGNVKRQIVRNWRDLP